MKAINEILSNEDYIKILKEKFVTKDIRFINANWSPLSDKIEGFMGDHYILNLSYILNNKEHEQQFFVKTKPVKNDSQREVAKHLNSFVKESFMYKHLFKEFKKMKFKTTFSPKCYYCKNDETMVMEDLKLSGFNLRERTKFFDMDHCKASLKALAYFHANSIAYEETKSKELGKTFRIYQDNPEAFVEEFYVLGDKDGPGQKWNTSGAECFSQLSQYMPETKEWKESFSKRIKQFDCAELLWKDLPYRQTCCHGDLWNNNMMFKYTNGHIDCCLIDFQVMRHHHPSFDALLILYSNTSRNFRKKHVEELLNYHYDQFDEILEGYGFDANKILPKEHYLKSAKVFEPLALFQGAGTRSIVLLPPDVISEAVNSGGNDYEELLFSDHRAVLATEAFKKDKKFKRIIMEDIYELNELI